MSERVLRLIAEICEKRGISNGMGAAMQIVAALEKKRYMIRPMKG